MLCDKIVDGPINIESIFFNVKNKLPKVTLLRIMRRILAVAAK